MNAIEILINEHISHRDLLQQSLQDQSVYPELRSEIVHHVNMEETILYPALLKLSVFEGPVRRVWEEHNLIMQLLQELDQDDITQETRKAKLELLQKLLDAHFEDEEKNIFPKLAKKASPEFLMDLGEQLLVQKGSEETEDILYPDVPGAHHLE